MVQIPDRNGKRIFVLGTEEKGILEAWEVSGAGRKANQSTADWPGYRNDWIEVGNRKDRLDERLKSLLLQARDCKEAIYLRKDFQKTWKRQGWGEGNWEKWKDDGTVFISKVGLRDQVIQEPKPLGQWGKHWGILTQKVKGQDIS